MAHVSLKRLKSGFTPIGSGFTLMELLIVIAIIGILVSVGVVSFSQAQKISRNSRRISDMKAVQTAWEQYYGDSNGSYPLTCDVDMSKYLPADFPDDPKNIDTGVAETTYTYDFANAHCSATSFCFCAHLESGAGNVSAKAAGSTCSYGSSSYYCVGNQQ